MQLSLPFKTPEPKPRLPADCDPFAVEVTVVDSWQKLYDELEGLIRHFQNTVPYGPDWRKTWEEARKMTCESHGWTEEDFFAELQRRKP